MANIAQLNTRRKESEIRPKNPFCVQKMKMQVKEPLQQDALNTLKCRPKRGFREQLPKDQKEKGNVQKIENRATTSGGFCTKVMASSP